MFARKSIAGVVALACFGMVGTAGWATTALTTPANFASFMAETCDLTLQNHGNLVASASKMAVAAGLDVTVQTDGLAIFETPDHFYLLVTSRDNGATCTMEVPSSRLSKEGSDEVMMQFINLMKTTYPNSKSAPSIDGGRGWNATSSENINIVVSFIFDDDKSKFAVAVTVPQN